MVGGWIALAVYSGNTKYDNSKSIVIWNRDFLKNRFQIILVFYRVELQLRYGYSPSHSKSGPFEIWTFLFDFKLFWQNGSHFSQFQMGCASGFQIPSKIWTICQPISFEHWKSALVWISGPHCTTIIKIITRIQLISVLWVIILPGYVYFENNSPSVNLFLKTCLQHPELNTERILIPDT